MEEARAADMPLLAALSVCRDLEDCLIERRLFEVVEGDSPELRSLLQRLTAETAAHREQMQKARIRGCEAAS